MFVHDMKHKESNNQGVPTRFDILLMNMFDCLLSNLRVVIIYVLK
jgi:hypothetical protein